MYFRVLVLRTFSAIVQ